MFCRSSRWLKPKRQSTHFPLLSCFYNWGLRCSKGPDISSLLLLTKPLYQNTSPCSMNLLTRWTIELNMTLTCQEISCDKIQELKLVEFLRKRKRPRKSWNLFNFYVEACEHYARTTCVNSDLKAQRWKLDNVKSTQEFMRVKFYFYVRFQFLRALTCVDKNATVEIHLKLSRPEARWRQW